MKEISTIMVGIEPWFQLGGRNSEEQVIKYTQINIRWVQISYDTVKYIEDRAYNICVSDHFVIWSLYNILGYIYIYTVNKQWILYDIKEWILYDMVNPPIPPLGMKLQKKDRSNAIHNDFVWVLLYVVEILPQCYLMLFNGLLNVT
jgi:hypothetical protein